MVFFGPLPSPPPPAQITKMDELQGKNLPLSALIAALRKIETGVYRAMRCCVMCETYWLIPKSEADPGMNFICPDCGPTNQGPYR